MSESNQARIEELDMEIEQRTDRIAELFHALSEMNEKRIQAIRTERETGKPIGERFEKLRQGVADDEKVNAPIGEEIERLVKEVDRLIEVRKEVMRRTDQGPVE